MRFPERTGVVATLAVGIGLGALVARTLDVQRAAAQDTADRRRAETELRQRFPAASGTLEVFTLAAKVASPSVVHITRKAGGEVYRDWVGFLYRVPESESVGSGVVVGNDGYILTNNHVVEGAKDIQVRFVSGHTTRGSVVGADPETDLAVVKIAPPSDIVAATLGDSDALQVGEWVLAIGSPFGLDHTVTAGIVSAVGRRRNLLPFEDFIQTDAAINPGNSGGALVNLKGEVVGVNAAIITQTGNYAGVGFAIPINLAKRVKDSLIKDGRVMHGFLGVEVRNIDESLAEHYDFASVQDMLRSLKLDAARGAFVAGFARDDAGSPAQKGGIREGDVILRFGDHAVQGVEDLIGTIVRTPPGAKVDVRVWRDGREAPLTVIMGERPNAAPDAARRRPRRR